MGYIGKESSRDKVGKEGKDSSKDGSKDGSRDRVEMHVVEKQPLIEKPEAELSMNPYQTYNQTLRGPREIFSF